MTPTPRLSKAVELLRRNQLREAERELNVALDAEPNNADCRFLLSVLYFRSGRADLAEPILTQLFQSTPTHLDAISLLGVVRKTLNNPTGALDIYQYLISKGQATADNYNHLGSCHLDLGHPIEAGHAFKKAIEKDRNLAHSYYNLGTALRLAGNSFETYLTFQRAIELDPSFFDSYVQLWQQMRHLLNWSEGLPILEQGLRQFPTSVQMMVIVASAYGKVGLSAKARTLYEAAMELEPTTGPAYAHWLQEDGRFEESIPILERAINANPVQGQAYYNLAVARKFELNGKSLSEYVTPLLVNPTIPAEEQMFLSYTLARVHEDSKNYGLAMKFYDQANDQAFDLYNTKEPYDEAAVASDYEVLTRLYTRENIAQLQAKGSRSRTPIFIVGMIRTGTTLLDQILSSHPKVESAGEQPFWQLSAGRVNRKWNESEVNPADLRELESRYLAVLKESREGATRVSDKMPINFNHIGLMASVFPKAKFIHTRRNPMDTCLSIYTTFLGSGTQFAYSQENIVRYYRNYFRLMEYWRQVLPEGQMIEIDYEDLVTNKETVLRELLAFCNLEWDDSCLNHEQNRSSVSTPSLYTARQPVNTASVERWRKYEPWLGRLLDLKDLNHPPTGRDRVSTT